MGRTRKTVVALAVAGSLTTGAACTGPPPSEAQVGGAIVGIIQVILLSIYMSNGGCIAPCDPPFSG